MINLLNILIKFAINAVVTAILRSDVSRKSDATMEEKQMREKKADWHNADIIAGLKKRGTTMAQVSREAGLSSSTLANALFRPWPKGEWIIANALNIHPAEIWPSRYYDPVTHSLLDRKKLIRS